MVTENKHDLVVLIDDNEIDNLVNKKLLEKNKFSKNITVYQSAKDLLINLKKAKAAQLPEIIFLDIMMPGMDGFQFLEEFEKLGAEIHEKCKIIMLSTSDSFKNLNRANKNKFVRKFLNKPLTEEMLAAINFNSLQLA